MLGIIIMGLSWGVPWFRSLTQSTYELANAYTFAALGGMVIAAYLLVRLLNHFQFNLQIRRGALGVLLIISLLVGLKTLLYETESVTLTDLATRPLRSFADAAALIPDEFIVILTVLFTWNWGVHLAQDNIEPARVIRSFQTGLGMFFFYIFVNTFVTGETFGSLANLFLFAGLMGMGAARVDSLSTLRGGRENPFDRRWLAGMILTGLGAVGIAGWLAAEISGEDTLLGILPRLMVGGVLVLGFLLATPLFIAGWYALFNVVQALRPDSELAQTLTGMMNLFQNMAGGFLDFMQKYLAPVEQFFARFGPWIKSGVLWAVVIGMAAAIILALVIRGRRRRAGMADDTQSLLGEMGLLDLLREAWRKRLDAITGRLAQVADFRRRRRLLAAARIRRIYADLMDLCEDLHHPRPDAITPLEFIPTMDAIFPDHHRELDTITSAYLRVRYGEFPETDGEVQSVERAWHTVREVGNDRKKGKGVEGE